MATKNKVWSVYEVGASYEGPLTEVQASSERGALDSAAAFYGVPRGKLYAHRTQAHDLRMRPMKLGSGEPAEPPYAWQRGLDMDESRRFAASLTEAARNDEARRAALLRANPPAELRARVSVDRTRIIVDTEANTGMANKAWRALRAANVHIWDTQGSRIIIVGRDSGNNTRVEEVLAKTIDVLRGAGFVVDVDAPSSPQGAKEPLRGRARSSSHSTIATRNYEYVVYPEASHRNTDRAVVVPRRRGQGPWDLTDAKREAKQMGSPAAIYSVSKGRFVGYVHPNGRYVTFR